MTEADVEDQDEDEDAEEELAKEPEPQPSEPASSPAQERDAARLELLKGQTFITREPNYESALFAKWEGINRKFHLVGWKHRRKAWAFEEMYSELESFLYELAGNVDLSEKDAEIAKLEEFLDDLRGVHRRKRIPRMFNMAANLFHKSKLGLKTPKDRSIFDLDVDKIFEGHLKRIEDRKRIDELVKP